MVEEYDDDVKECENEDDRVLIYGYRRIRPWDERNGRDLVWNFQERGGVDGDLDNIKMQLLALQGWNDPKAYLEWEKKIELIYNCYNYFEDKKVKLAIINSSIMP